MIFLLEARSWCTLRLPVPIKCWLNRRGHKEAFHGFPIGINAFASACELSSDHLQRSARFGTDFRATLAPLEQLVAGIARFWAISVVSLTSISAKTHAWLVLQIKVNASARSVFLRIIIDEIVFFSWSRFMGRIQLDVGRQSFGTILWNLHCGGIWWLCTLLV